MHTVPQVCAASLGEGLPGPSRRSITLIDSTHSLPFLLLVHEFQTPSSGGPFIPRPYTPARPGPQPTIPSCCIPCSLFLEPAVHKNSNASSVHLTLSLWRRHRLARTSFSEVTLGPVSLILSRQARLHGEFVLLLPRGRSW